MINFKDVLNIKNPNIEIRTKLPSNKPSSIDPSIILDGHIRSLKSKVIEEVISSIKITNHIFIDLDKDDLTMVISDIIKGNNYNNIMCDHHTSSIIMDRPEFHSEFTYDTNSIIYKVGSFMNTNLYKYLTTFHKGSIFIMDDILLEKEEKINGNKVEYKCRVTYPSDVTVIFTKDSKRDYCTNSLSFNRMDTIDKILK